MKSNHKPYRQLFRLHNATISAPNCIRCFFDIDCLNTALVAECTRFAKNFACVGNTLERARQHLPVIVIWNRWSLTGKWPCARRFIMRDCLPGEWWRDVLMFNVLKVNSISGACYFYKWLHFDGYHSSGPIRNGMSDWMVRYFFGMRAHTNVWIAGLIIVTTDEVRNGNAMWDTMWHRWQNKSDEQ